MRMLAPVVAAVLASCSAAEPQTPPIASAGAPNPQAQAAALREVGFNNKPTDPSPRQNFLADKTNDSAAKERRIDSGTRLETVDLWVDPTDSSSNRQLAAYFLRAGEWMLVQYEFVSLNSRHYKFQRMIGVDAQRLPELDPLLRKKN